MTHIDKHPAGSFCWIELATTDQKAAKDFYSSLFGWSPQDSPIGPSEFYTIFKLEGRDAAAGYTLREDQRAHGVPPNWMIYITVDSADQAAAKAKQLGGTVVMTPFDVMDLGRMAVIQDPTGAHFCVWQAAKIPASGSRAFPDRSAGLISARLTPSAPATSIPPYSDGRSWPMRKTSPATCTSTMADTSSEAFRPRLIVLREYLHTGSPISGWMTWTVRPRRQNKWVPTFTC